jgi:hypothetical protein
MESQINMCIFMAMLSIITLYVISYLFQVYLLSSSCISLLIEEAGFEASTIPKQGDSLQRPSISSTQGKLGTCFVQCLKQKANQGNCMGDGGGNGDGGHYIDGMVSWRDSCLICKLVDSFIQ